MASPVVPSRPSRSNQHLTANLSSQASGPQIPPRPEKRNKDGSVSPARHCYDRSPLHGSLFAAPSDDSSKNNAENKSFPGTNASRDTSYDKKYLHSSSRKDAPSLRRPPSVSTLPSVGQEGNEYASLADEYAKPSTKPGVPEQTSVKQDLPLHAPKASMPSTTAKSRISTVTRTDSTQAAAAGIGRPSSGHDDKAGNSSRGQSRSASAAGEKVSQARDRGEHHLSRSGSAIGRPASSQSQKEEYEEQGIPEIGLQVPMYPNAGDVQAPTPSPFPHQDGTGSRRHDMKRRSTREVFTGPPGSYGLRGHGVEPRDPFERAWYEKHPDQLEKEGHGEYGPGIHGVRSEWALSSNDLNKLVHESTHGAAGLGASEDAVAQSIPDEQIGYIASEEYARLISPRPQSATDGKRHSGSGDTPLRKSFVPEDVDNQDMKADEEATEDASDDEVIHIDPMTRRMSRVDDGNEQEADQEKAETADYDDVDENQAAAYSAPILAADEVAKRPEAEYMQPAVPPEWERAPTATYIDSDENNVTRRSGSRPSSRPNSFHAPSSGGNPMIKLMSADEHDHSSTPLEEIHEYEPLFPSDEEDDEKKDSSTKLGKGNNEDKKRKMPHRPKLDAHSHRFPSMDIWEDTPGSAQLQTIVATPQLPDDEDKSMSSAVARKPTSTRLFEPPSAEEARKREEGMSAADRTSYLPSKAKAMADPRYKPGVLEEMHMQDQQYQRQHQNQDRATGRRRPGMQNRFPSRDVWEDTPDHFRLVTTVGGPQQSEESTNAGAAEPATSGDVEDKSAVKPSIPPRSSRSQAQEQEPIKNQNNASPSPVDRAQVPAIPSRPKPKLPARPAKLVSKDSGEQSPLSRAMSADSDGSSGSGAGGAPTSAAGTSVPPQTKAKPTLPPRPAGGAVGNKIAALKAGFMSDLNSKLKMGPAAATAAVIGAGVGMVAGAKGSSDGDATDSAEDSTGNKAVTVERAPLDDARKGRARGPAGRRRAAGAATAAVDDSSKLGVKNEAMSLSISGARTVWRLGDDGVVDVPSMQSAISTSSTNAGAEGNEASNSSTGGAATPATQDTNDTNDKDTSTVTSGNGSKNTAIQSTPPTSSSTQELESKSPSKMTSSAAQTGQIDISVPAIGSGGSGSGNAATEDKMTVYIDGAAPESGNIVVKHKGVDGDEAASGSRDDTDNAAAANKRIDDENITSTSVKDSDEVIVENKESGEERVVKAEGEKA